MLLLDTPTAASLPLDGAANVTGAWSSRRLVSSYTGPLLRIRRALDDMVLDVYDVDELAEFLSETDGFVVTVYDQSPLENHMYQDNPLLQPRISLAHPSLGNRLGILGESSGWIRSDYDIPVDAQLLIAYADHTDGCLYGGFMNSFFPSTSATRWRLNAGGPLAYTYADGEEVTTNHNIVLFDWNYDTDVYRCWLDGTLVIDKQETIDYPLSGGNPGQLMLMATRSTGQNPMTGVLAEAVLFEGGNTAHINAAAQAMADYFGFTWSSI